MAELMGNIALLVTIQSLEVDLDSLDTLSSALVSRNLMRVGSCTLMIYYDDTEVSGLSDRSHWWSRGLFGSFYRAPRSFTQGLTICHSGFTIRSPSSDCFYHYDDRVFVTIRAGLVRLFYIEDLAHSFIDQSFFQRFKYDYRLLNIGKIIIRDDRDVNIHSCLVEFDDGLNSVTTSFCFSSKDSVSFCGAGEASEQLGMTPAPAICYLDSCNFEFSHFDGCNISSIGSFPR